MIKKWTLIIIALIGYCLNTTGQETKDSTALRPAFGAKLTSDIQTDFKETRMDLCLANKLLIVTPWLYSYRRVGDTISVAECKAMNCVVQSICRTKDSWWKE